MKALFFLSALIAATMASSAPLAPITKKVFFDVSIGGQMTGRVVMGLFGNTVPKTVENFVALSNGSAGTTCQGIKRTFSGSNFHRVIPGFMAQGGCPNSREGARGTAGTGGPGYQINCEINSQKHQAGSLAMAHAGKNTGGSQFYICHGAQPHLDGVHTVFGLTGNMDVVTALKNGSRINKVTIQD